MRTDFLPFSKPTIQAEDIQAVVEVLKSGWITTGPKTLELETKFCSYVGCPHAVALASATAGMHLVLKALGIGPGDEVITPSMTWVSTVNLIALSGATPVFVDVDLNSLLTSAELIEGCISDRTRLIIPVHFAGVPVDLEPIRKLASRSHAVMVEDAAHAVGTKYRGDHIGQQGTAIFSFHPIKNMTTGEGGMVCSDDSEFLDKLRRLRFHGLGVDAFDRQTQGRAPQAEVLEPGYKYNLTDMAAALGLRQLVRLDDFIRRRTELAAYYSERLAEIEEILPLEVPTYPLTHAWHLFIVRLDVDRARLSRDDFMAELKHRHIGTGLHFRAVHLQKYYRETMNIQRGSLPNSEWNSDRICSLPLFPDMSVPDVDDVVDAIKDALSK
jgi:UDP-4-amino-4-deoxy-L-arabinose-oxoglutarate aminotransferase